MVETMRKAYKEPQLESDSDYNSRLTAIVERMRDRVFENWMDGKTPWGEVTQQMKDQALKDDDFHLNLVRWAAENKDKSKKIDDVSKLRNIAAEWVLRDLSDEPQGYEYIAGLQNHFEIQMDLVSVKEKLKKFKESIDHLIPPRKLVPGLLIATMVISACSPRSSKTSEPEVFSTQPRVTEVFTMTPTEISSPTFAPTKTRTVVPTYEPTKTVTPEPTTTPEATIDPKVEQIRELVGDEVSDWVIWHGEMNTAVNKLINAYEVKLIYEGASSQVNDLEFYDGEGNAIGKIIIGFKGQYLIGDNLHELIIPFVYKYYGSPDPEKQCVMQGDQYWKCEPGVDRYSDASQTVEKIGPNQLEWTPGEVISIYIYAPGRITDPSKPTAFENFNTAQYNGREELFDKFIEEGDPEIGILFPLLYRKQCDANNLARVPFFCKQEVDKIIVPGY